ncbi:MAG: asparagine synthase [Sphingopyxis sp.]|nr:asparagine synthase [Sphingopyxis sp.]
MTLRIALLTGRGRAPLPDGFVDAAAIGRARLLVERNTPAGIANGAALIGWAFHRQGGGPCESLSPSEVERLVSSDGAWAIRELWGNFLLFWADPTGRTMLLRSPMTGPPLFCFGEFGIAGAVRVIAFTDLSLARSLGFALDEPDPARIDAWMRFPLLRGAEGEIRGVRELLPGEIIALEDRRPLPTSWSPWDHTHRPPERIEPEHLRDKVSRTVSAWSMRFERVQLELSGGIDSSIMAACLAGRRRPWRGLTMATADPDGDERPYARAVAERVGAPLAEWQRPSFGDPMAPVGTLRARPGGFGLLGPSDRAYLEAAREFDADAIFTGTGGDNVFGYLTSAAPVLDALRYAGPIAAWRAAGDLARLANDNMWRALGYSAKRLVKPPALWPVDHSLLSGRYSQDCPNHPWMPEAHRASPGQQVYAIKLLIAQPFLDGYDRALAMPMIAPLLSQPIIEFTLGVPSWQWGEGGQNRALARKAFRRDLPEMVIERLGKGRILSVFLPAFEAHRSRLRSYLLDGWLAGAGLLDLDAIADLFADDRRPDPVMVTRLLSFADIERWARSVTGHADIA